MRKIILFTVVILFCIFAVGSILAQDDYAVKVLIDEVVPVRVNSPQRVLISNPAIADINVVSANEILIIGKKPGDTSLLVWEGDLQRTIPIRVLSEDPQKVISEARSQLSNLKIKGVKIREENGKVLASGEVISKENLDSAKEVFSRYSSIINLVRLKEDRPLVEISVQILELSSTLTKELGFEWPTQYEVKAYPPGYVIGSANPLDSSVRGNISDAVGVRGWTAALDANVLSGKINLSIQEGDTRVLSRPRMVTLSGKDARIVVGGEIPVVTTTLTEAGSQEDVEYKDYGIIMDITPTVTEENRVNIKVSAEISDVDTNYGSTTKPAFTTRNMNTELFLKSDQTVIIGGLIKKKTDEDIDRFPFLSKIPILGEFFKNRTAAGDVDTELVITITPKVIRIDEDEEVSEEDILQTWEEKIAKEELSPSLMQASTGVFAYSASVQKRVNEGIYYPYGAREAGIEGMVKLSLHILSNGDLLDVIVRETSGYKVLDNAAIDVAKSQAPYPRFPSGVNLKELWVDMPIVYRLGTKK